VEIKKKEYNKFHSTDGFIDSHEISKENKNENLLKIIDKKKRPHNNDGHPFIRKLLWGEEDIHKDVSVDEMTLMIEMDSQKSLFSLNGPVNIPHPVQEKMRQTPDPEDENMIEVVEDEPEEEPPENHTTKKEVKRTQYPEDGNMIEVVEDEPEEEPPDIHATKKEVKRTQLNMLSPTSTFSTHESQDNQQYTMYTQHGTAYRDAKTFQGNLTIEDTYREDVLAVIFEVKDGLLMINKAAYREGKDAKTFKGTLIIGDTYKEDMLAVTFEEKDVLLMIDIAYKGNMLSMSTQEDMLTVSQKVNVELVKAYKSMCGRQ
jgi:hypothetical protein